MTALKKVLVVDDDPVVGKSFDRVLAPKGYAVIHAAGGAEALERLAADSYGMVYTDIRMPGCPVAALSSSRRSCWITSTAKASSVAIKVTPSASATLALKGIAARPSDRP